MFSSTNIFLIDGCRSPYKWYWKFADLFFRRWRWTLIAEVVNFGFPQPASQKDKKTWIKLSDNVAFLKQSWKWWNRMSLFCMKPDFSTIFTELARQRFRCTIASIWNKKHCKVFCFSFGKIWFPDWVRFFLHQYQKFYRRFFVGYRRK